MNIWGRKQQNREEKLQFWATNPEIAEIFPSWGGRIRPEY